MAFVQLQTWDARLAGASPAMAAEAPPADARPEQRRFRRRCAAAIISVLVHLLLLRLFTAGLPPGLGGLPDAGAESGAVTLLDLSPPSSEQKPKPERSLVPPVPSPPAMVDSSADVALPPPEWSVSRIEAVAPPRTAPAASNESTTASAGAGQPGNRSSGFDPYAGAAPLPRDTAGIDTAALEAIRGRVSRFYPEAQGTVELVVRIAGTGSIVEARISGGTAPAEVKEALRKAVIGARLFAASPEQARTTTLPTLQFN